MNTYSSGAVEPSAAHSESYDLFPGHGFASAAKRCYDLVLAFLGLLLLSPIFLLLAIVIKAADRGPVLYRQERVGWRGRPFQILKFRTMVPRAELAGPSVTRDGDARITFIGRFLRRTKLDELPQLWNVLKGEMSLVGPRPEVPKYMARYTPEQRLILTLKPGVTDLASLHFRNEEMLLKHAEDVETFYLQQCVPRKVELNLEYARRASLFTDTWIILQTLFPYWICLLSVYTAVLAASFWASFQLVHGLVAPQWGDLDFVGGLVAVVSVQLGALIWRKQCKGLLSYFSLPELRQITLALGFAGALLLGLGLLTGRARPSWNLLVVDTLVSLCALGALRLGLRYWRESSAIDNELAAGQPLRVGIIGAGRTGSQLARELMTRKELGRRVVAFFDDDVQKWHRRIHEVPVVGMPECLAEGWEHELDEIIIALPGAPAERVRAIDELLKRAGLRAYRAYSTQTLWSRKRTQSPEDTA